MVKSAVVRHMSSVEDYRGRLASLQGSWDTLSLLSHLRGDGADVSGTRQAFEALANDLVHSLSEVTYKKAMLALEAKGQIAIDVMVRNLFERTADIGFLAIDDDIRDYLRQRRADGANVATLNDRLRRRFREYVGKYSVYHDVVLLDAEGQVLVRLDDKHHVARTSHDLLRETLTTRQGYVETFGRVDLAPESDRSLIYSFRVGDAGRTEGVLCLCFRFDDEVAGIFAKLRAADDWTVFCFLDAKGSVIASSDPWQTPMGATLPVVLEAGGRVVRFAGREYLAVTRRTQGYQGYMGPGWYGHAMLPIEHAFDHAAEQTNSVPSDLLAALRESETIFSPDLRKIPSQADAIQRELNRTVWNGNVRLASSTDSGSDFTKVLLREIGNAGRRTQETFERSISELQETVVSSILDDAQLLAALAVDVLDRNLYERANDCRWWALNGALSRHLSAQSSANEQDASEILRHINSLYTVYHDIVLFDAAGRIVAVSNVSHASKVGQILNGPWVAATLELRDSQQFAVSAFEPCDLYDGRHTLVYGAAIRNDSRRVVGGIGIVFDSAPQFKAMLRDALPRTDSGEIASGCIGLFVDARLSVVAATSQFEPGDTIDLPRDLLDAQANTARTVCINGVHYAIGVRKTSGYREYTGMGVFSVILIPLGPALEQIVVRRAEPQSHRRAHTESVVDVATFYCGDQRLGLMRNEIVEALDGAHIRPIPNAPAWHAGLLMYREMPMPVIDLGRLLNAGQGTRARNVIVVRAAETAQSFGLLVEELADIPEIAVSRILPVHELNTRGPAILDRAVRPEHAEEQVLMIINIEQLLICARAAGLKLAPPTASVTKLRVANL
jgi:chemotaxis signal transduction protein